MAKKATTGKRYSKREKITPRDEQELAGHLKTIGRPSNKGGYVVGYGFPERLERIKQSAEELLQGKGLPTAPVVWWAGGEPKPKPSEICADFPIPAEQVAQGFTRCDLLHYVEKIAGHKKDSPEWLCAKIIALMSRIESGQGEHRDAALFDLGGVVCLAKVYGIDSAHNAAKVRKRWGSQTALNAEIAQAATPHDVRTIAENPDMGRALLYRLIELYIKPKYRRARSVTGAAAYRDAVRAGDVVAYTVDDAWNELIEIAHEAGLHPVETWNSESIDKSTIGYSGDRGRPLTRKTLRNNLSK